MSTKELVRTGGNQTSENLVELNGRRDSFANRVRLLWNPQDGSLLLRITSTRERLGFDTEVPPDQGNEYFEHPYPYALEAEKKRGSFIVSRLIEPTPIPEAA